MTRRLGHCFAQVAVLAVRLMEQQELAELDMKQAAQVATGESPVQMPEALQQLQRNGLPLAAVVVAESLPVLAQTVP